MTPDRVLYVKLPDDMHKALRVRAAEHGIPMSEIVRELIAAYLEGRITLPPRKREEGLTK